MQRQQSTETDGKGADGSSSQEDISLQRMLLEPKTEDTIFIYQNIEGDDMPEEMSQNIVLLSDHDSNDFRFSFIEKCCKTIKPRRQQEHGGGGDQVDGAYERKISFCPPPLTMTIISVIQIIIFLIDEIYLNLKDDPNPNFGKSKKGPAAKLFNFDPYRRYEAWRFISYMFVHVGINHLCINLAYQLFFGIALEVVHRWWRVALVYLAGVAAGSMVTSLSSPKIVLSGASAGVNALMAAHIATVIMNYSDMDYCLTQFWLAFVFCLCQLGDAIYSHMNDKNNEVAHMAHLAGAVAGLLVGIGVLRNLKERSWERILWWIAVFSYFAFMFSGIMVQIFCSDYFPQNRAMDRQ